MIWTNTLKQKLRDGATVLGTIVQVPHPLMVEACGRAGFDFVILDMEHGAIGTDRLADLIRAAEVAGLAPLVRVTENRPALILQALDQGGWGVVIPGVNSGAEAEYAVQAAKYAPMGSRGYCSAVRSAGLVGLPGSLERANAETMVVPLVESRQAVGAFDAIIETPGVDVAFIGPGDLSHSLGVPGQLTHPTVQEAVARMIAAAAGKGRWVGVHVKRPEDAARYARLGARFLNYGMDVQMVTQALGEIVTGAREAVRAGAMRTSG